MNPLIERILAIFDDKSDDDVDFNQFVKVLLKDKVSPEIRSLEM